MTQTQFISSIAVVVFLFFAWMSLQRTPSQSFSGINGSPVVIGVATTSNAVHLTGAASTRILATTTNTIGTGYTRVYASICNPSATIVGLSLNNDRVPGTTASSTVFIGAAAGYNACYEIGGMHAYQGSIQASSTAAAVTIIVNDYVQ